MKKEWLNGIRINDPGKKIVVVTVVDKKTQKVNKKLKELYERVGGYEYEFKD